MKHTRLIFSSILLLIIYPVLTGQIVSPLIKDTSKYLGCAWSTAQAPKFNVYWNQVSPENGGKWGSVEGTKNVMRWTEMDSAYKNARKYHMFFKEHTLVWGAQQPSWIGGLDSATQHQEIEAWFAAIAARYDTIDYIDVVNEPIHNAPDGMTPYGATQPNVNYAKALGGKGKTGWDWIINAFRLARQYFPKSKLIMNEYNVINSSTTTQQYIVIVNLLKAENLIDGIGEQAHAFTTYGVPAATLKNNLDALATTGIPIHLTEVDIDGETDLKQLQEMQRVFPIFWKHSGVKGITFWGFRNGLWRTAQGAFLVTSQGVERPALKWLRAYVNDSVKLIQTIRVTSTSKDTLFVGEKLQMSTSILPDNATIKNVTWSISNTSIATIDTLGKLTAKASGKITVTTTAWDGSKVTGTKEIVVINRLVQSIEVFSTTKDTMPVNATLQMNATVLPVNATNLAINWSISPSNLASISSTGLLTATAKGKLTIIASAKDASGVSGTKDIVINDNSTGILSTKNFENVSIFPNPLANGYLTIQGIDKIKQIEIFDLTGRKQAEFNNIKQSFLQVLLKVKPGVYIIKLYDGQQSAYEKIMVNE